MPIDYYLKAAADKVTIEILDAQGQVVRTLHRRAGEGRRRSPRRRPSEEESFRPPAPRVPVKAGMNRFVWDMRYPGREGLPEDDPVGGEHARARWRLRAPTGCG